MSYEQDLEDIANGEPLRFATVKIVKRWNAALYAERHEASLLAALAAGEALPTMNMLELQAVWRMRQVELTVALRGARAMQWKWFVALGALAGAAIALWSTSLAVEIAATALVLMSLLAFVANRAHMAQRTKTRDIADTLQLTGFPQPRVEWRDTCTEPVSFYVEREPPGRLWKLPTDREGNPISATDRTAETWRSEPRLPSVVEENGPRLAKER